MSDDYVFVSGYSVDAHIRKKPSKSDETSVIDCAFCGASGVHPGSVMNEDCTCCNGKGRIRIRGTREDYSDCNRCGGSGTNQDSISVDPCHVCKGSGLNMI